MQSDPGLIRRRRTARACGVIACLALSQAALAVPYGTPLWSRPTSAAAATANRSTYQVSDIFSDDVFVPGAATIEDLEPDLVNLNPNGNTAVNETSGNAFIAGSGNIYGFSGPLSIKLDVPGYSPIAGASTMFLVQFETQGTELVRTSDNPITNDFAGLSVNGTPIASLREFRYAELSRTFLGSGDTFGGYAVQHQIAFTLPASASVYDVRLTSREAHVSLADLTLDTFVRIAGDLNYDGVRNVVDLDLLLRTPAGAAATGTRAMFDLNNDLSLTLTQDSGSDADYWVKTLANTRFGDTNLDGDVDFDDLLVLAQNYNVSGAAIAWTQGDFDGTSSVNFDDLLALAKNYNFAANPATAAGSASFEADWTLAQAVVPEPTSVIALSVVSVATFARRRR